MQTIDYIMMAILAGFTIWGLFKGIVRQIGDLAGLILGVVGANLWGNEATLWLHNQMPDWSLLICQLLAYFGVFLAIYLTIRIITYFIHALTKLVKLGWIDSLLGGAFGAFKTLLLTSIALNLLMLITKDADVWRSKELTQAICYEPVKQFAPQVLHIVWDEATNTATDLLNVQSTNNEDERE